METTIKNIKKKLESFCEEQLATSQKSKHSEEVFIQIIKKNAESLYSDNQHNFKTEKELSELKKKLEDVVEKYASKYIKWKNTSYVTAGTNSTYTYIGNDTDPYTKNGSVGTANISGSFVSAYAATNATYSMADMVATVTISTPFGVFSQRIGEIQSLSYSVFQQKTPVRNIGNMNAKDWVFGPRTIAGSIVFAVFNKHWLMNIYDKIASETGGNMRNYHFIADEIPPFDITISFANEYGYDSRMAIYGVRLMNEGQSMSVNDIFVENTYQYVAADIDLMDSLGNYQSKQSRHRYVPISSAETKTPVEENQKEKTTPVPVDNSKNDSDSETDNTDKKKKKNPIESITPFDLNLKNIPKTDEEYEKLKKAIRDWYEKEKNKLVTDYSGHEKLEDAKVELQSMKHDYLAKIMEYFNGRETV